MKKRVINLVIGACYRIDKSRGVLEHYEYEDAPYCGYHKSGTDGVLYSSSYAEGDGGESADILGFRFCASTDDEYWWSFKYKVVRDVYLDGDFITTHDCKSFLKQITSAFNYYKNGFSLRYRIKIK